MARWNRLRASGLLLLPLVGLLVSVARAEDSDSPLHAELQRLAGKWELVSITANGEQRGPNDQERESPLVIDGRSMETQNLKLTFTIDPATDPKVIDVTLEVEGRPTFEGIYKLEDDKLLFCIYAEQGAKQRPTKFVSEAGSNLTLVEYKRLK